MRENFNNPYNKLEFKTPAVIEEQTAEKLKVAIMAGLEKYGVLSYEAGKPVFDVKGLENFSSRKEIYSAKHKVTQLDIIKTLAGINGSAKLEKTDNPVDRKKYYL